MTKPCCPVCQSIEFSVYKDRCVCFACGNQIVFYQIPENYVGGLPMPNNQQVTKDAMGREYHHTWFDVQTNAIVCEKGVNRVFQGVPQLITRNGDSVFGNEVIIQFVVLNEKEPYPCNSPYKHIEIYLPKEKAVEILEKMLKKLREEKKP